MPQLLLPFAFRDGRLLVSLPRTQPLKADTQLWFDPMRQRLFQVRIWLLCSLELNTARQFGLLGVLLGCSLQFAAPDNLQVPSRCREEVCLLVCLALLLGWLRLLKPHWTGRFLGKRRAYDIGISAWGCEAELGCPGTCGQTCNTYSGSITR